MAASEKVISRSLSALFLRRKPSYFGIESTYTLVQDCGIPAGAACQEMKQAPSVCENDAAEMAPLNITKDIVRVRSKCRRSADFRSSVLPTPRRVVPNRHTGEPISGQIRIPQRPVCLHRASSGKAAPWSGVKQRRTISGACRRRIYSTAVNHVRLQLLQRVRL